MIVAAKPGISRSARNDRGRRWSLAAGRTGRELLRVDHIPAFSSIASGRLNRAMCILNSIVATLERVHTAGIVVGRSASSPAVWATRGSCSGKAGRKHQASASSAMADGESAPPCASGRESFHRRSDGHARPLARPLKVMRTRQLASWENGTKIPIGVRAFGRKIEKLTVITAHEKWMEWHSEKGRRP